MTEQVEATTKPRVKEGRRKAGRNSFICYGNVRARLRTDFPPDNQGKSNDRRDNCGAILMTYIGYVL